VLICFEIHSNAFGSLDPLVPAAEDYMQRFHTLNWNEEGTRSSGRNEEVGKREREKWRGFASLWSGGLTVLYVLLTARTRLFSGALGAPTNLHCLTHSPHPKPESRSTAWARLSAPASNAQ